MNEDKITLEFEDGVEVETEVLGAFDFKGKDYIALAQVDGDEVYLYRYTETEDGMDLEDIPEDEFDAVAEEFDTIMSQLEG